MSSSKIRGEIDLGAVYNRETFMETTIKNVIRWENNIFIRHVYGAVSPRSGLRP